MEGEALRVAVIQMEVDGESRANNQRRAFELIAKAAEMDPVPEVICLPGRCEGGALAEGDVAASAVASTTFTEVLASQAREMGVSVVVGFAEFDGQHQALAVREDEFLTMYRRMWDDLPEADYVPGQPPPNESSLPPRTEHHATVIRGESPDPYGRGLYFDDWDCSVYHFVGTQPVDGTMAHYKVTIDAGVPARPGG